MNIDQEVKDTLPQSKILIVEDQPMNVVLLQSILSSYYQVSAVESGEDAINECRTNMPDLILLDIQLTGISGVEVCQHLKSDPRTKDIPIIFITSLQEHEDFFWEAGGVDFIPKPISYKTVFNRVKSHLTLKLQRDKIKALAFLDSLTGIYNRRYFDTHLAQTELISQRNDDDYALLLIDIDFFKQFNDTYGHINGDIALVKVAETIVRTLNRPSDFVARFGGEEFAVVLPSTNLNGGKLIAEKIIENILALNLTHGSSPFKRLTISIGLTTYRNLDNNNKIIQQADENLYSAKRSGRNQVTH
ncbi:GGDEF domain-containing response regulator [Thalassotalea piscium]|uniref:diguanylate cyclase n=1 Tax=Thalassotalea piscium TaxID=1230533 RepID=A0A7X0NE74_9GAMM|nr:diguanylate cyclase [Thalassotalea piscium]MBB6541797.1 diguanylate cyclase (GGDEF)-like protein [Thalassotalea piscium]